MDTNQAKKALSLIKAIAYTENGGKPNVSKSKAGGSGELKSVLQYMPATWKEYSKQVTGKDDTPLTPETEMAVAYGKINDWMNHGYSDEQIFSMWNAGNPDAYKGTKGVNRKGIAYDTPGYVKKATNYLKQFNTEETKTPQNQGSSSDGGQSSGLMPSTNPAPTNSGMISG